MNERGEVLVVQPRRPRRGLAVSLVAVLAVLLATLLSLHHSSAGCEVAPLPVAPSSVSSAPQIAPDDALVRDLHFHAAERRRTAADEPPTGIVPAEVRRSARRVAQVDGVTVYLAPGAGFTCLGVEGKRVLEASVSQGQSKCLPNWTVINRGLVLTLWLHGSDDPVVVVALPDHTELVTEAGTAHLADAPNVAVLRPGDDAVRQRPPGHPPVVVYASPRFTAEPPSC